MKYLCLVYYDEVKMGQLTQAEWDDLNQECIACVEGLVTRGNFIDGAPLMTTDTALSVRIRDDKPLITDGPFAETKEQLAGFYMIEARDMNDALRLAQKIPPARYGTVEVRPVRELKVSDNER